MKIFKCDFCQKDLNEDTNNKIKYLPSRKSKYCGMVVIEYDLCNECTEKIMDYIEENTK